MWKAAVAQSSWPSRPIIPAVHRGIWLLVELLVHSLSCSWRNSLTALCHPESSSTLHISSRTHWRSATLVPPTTIFYPFLWTLYGYPKLLTGNELLFKALLKMKMSWIEFHSHRIPFLFKFIIERLQNFFAFVNWILFCHKRWISGRATISSSEGNLNWNGSMGGGKTCSIETNYALAHSFLLVILFDIDKKCTVASLPPLWFLAVIWSGLLRMMSGLKV